MSEYKYVELPILGWLCGEGDGWDDVPLDT